jgi:thiamine biosynthesis protein ThiI
MVSEECTIIVQANVPDRTTTDDRRRLLQTLERNLKVAFGENDLDFMSTQIENENIIVKSHDVDNIMKIASKVFGVLIVTDARDIADDSNTDSEPTLSGIGGLPTGFQGPVVCMISSGLDSPVASFKVMRRGCVPIFVYFDNSPFSDTVNKDVAIKQAKRLSQYIHGIEVRMYIVPHGEDLVEVLKHAPRRMTCIFCRRNMYRLAQEVAIQEGADAIVTGEIIGEQASQTTSNLYAENSAIDKIPIIRPCIGDDKDEIVEKAREIGTYEFAEEATSCCSLPPKYPVIAANINEIPLAEEKIGEDWVKYAVSDAEIIILKEG